MRNLQTVCKGIQVVVRRSNWDLYCIDQDPGNTPKTWEQLESDGPARRFETHHHYVLAPNPEHGQTLREAYRNKLDTKPALVLDSIADHVDMNGEQPLLVGGTLIYSFSRIILDSEKLACWSPPLPAGIEGLRPYLEIRYRSDTAKFERHFKIITRKDMKGFNLVLSNPKCN